MKQFTNNELLTLFEHNIAQMPTPEEPQRLYAPIKYGLEVGGKRIRPTLLMLAYNLYADDIERTSTTEELTAIWEQIQETGFLSWKVNPKLIDVNAEDFVSLSIEDKKRFLIECLDKNLLYVPFSEIGNEEFGISESDKLINNNFYGKN